MQTDALAPDTEQSSLTARFIEGEQTLRQCAGAMEAIQAIQAALNTAALSNLADCGDLMVIPFGLADGVETRGGWFCNWGAGYGVTFSPLYQNPWGDMSCPRVQAEFEYACFSRKDTE